MSLSSRSRSGEARREMIDPDEGDENEVDEVNDLVFDEDEVVTGDDEVKDNDEDC